MDADVYYRRAPQYWYHAETHNELCGEFSTHAWTPTCTTDAPPQYRYRYYEYLRT